MEFCAIESNVAYVATELDVLGDESTPREVRTARDARMPAIEEANACRES